MSHSAEDPVGTEGGEPPVGPIVLGDVDKRLSDDRIHPRIDQRFDPVDADSEVDSGRARIADAKNLTIETVAIPAVAFALAHRHRHTEGADGAERRRAAHDQPLDCVNDLIDAITIDVLLDVWKFGLIEQPQPAARGLHPLNRSNVPHVFPRVPAAAGRR